jgi:hypothetical protein
MTETRIAAIGMTGRGMRAGVLGWLTLLAAVTAATAVLADDLTEESMTQKDYASITAVVPDGPTAALEEAPTPVHEISENVEKFIANPVVDKSKPNPPPLGQKVVNGEKWKAETPEQRNAHLRNIRENAPAGSWLVISVPDGDVWLFFDVDSNYMFVNLYVYRAWQEWERTELPSTVRRERKVSQSDRHASDGFAAAPEER